MSLLENLNSLTATANSLDKDKSYFLKTIEPEIKKRYNLVMPALYIKLLDSSLILEVKDLEKFFNSFGEVKFTSINNRHFYVLFDHYFSAVFCYNTIEYLRKEKNIAVNVKLLENEVEPIKKEFSYFDLMNITNNTNSDKLSFNLDSKPFVFKDKKIEYKHINIYYVQIENDKYQVGKRIIGKEGINLKNIISSCPIEHKVKIRLRGKGSGYKEPDTKEESNDPLQLCVSSLQISSLSVVSEKIESLLLVIYKDYDNYNKKKRLLRFCPTTISKHYYKIINK